jgi:predicted RND superfamily exporter protein
MERIFYFAYDRARLMMVLFVAVTALLAIPAWRQFKLDVSPDGLMPRQTPMREGYESTKKVFGSDVLATVYVRDSKLFTYPKLAELRRIQDELTKIEGVEKTESLFTVNNIRNDNGSLDTAPLLDYIPNDPAELREKQSSALHNPLLKRGYISDDGNATLITVYLSKKEGDLKFDRRVMNEMDRILSNHRENFEEIFQTGDPFINTSMANFIFTDQLFIVPLSVIILLGSIWFSMRSIHCALIPLLNSIISIIWTLGIMGLLGIPINLLSYIVPALSLVVGATEDIFMCAEYLEGVKEGKSPRELVGGFGRKLGIILLFTGGTTIFGFWSIAITNLVIMRDFGHASGLCMTANFIATLLFVPSYLSLFGQHMKPPPAHDESHHSRFVEAVARGIANLITNHRLGISVFFATTFVLACAASFKLVLNNDFISFFRAGSPIVRTMNVLHENLVGARVMYITLTKEAGDFKLAKGLKQADEVERYLKDLKVFDSVTGMADYIRLVNREMNDGNEKCYEIPTSDNLIAQYLLLFQRADLERYVSPDYSQVNIVVRHNINATNRFNEILAKIDVELKSGRFGHFKHLITGQTVLVAQSADNIAWGQAWSLLSNIILIFLCMWLMFLSPRAGLVAIVPNIWPIAIFFAVMALLNIPLSVGTAMVAAITLGIAVDDTIHLMGVYNHNLKMLGNERLALEETIRGDLVPVLASGLSLAAGFLVLAFSSFVPVAQFGILSAFVIGIALVGELVVTPMLLSSVRLITLWEAVGLKLRERLIESAALFQGMRRWQIRRLILMSDLKEEKAGATVIRAGDVGDCMYLVVDGQLSVHRIQNGVRTQVGTMDAGDAFGELALITKEKRTADVVAETDVKLLALNWSSLERLRRFMPHISSKFFLNLSRILGTRWMEAVQQAEKKP